MRTTILAELKEDPDVQVSEEMLRNCVHCGFCNATCPTYLLTGNELEGPRGRIYLIKSMLEGRIEPSRQTVAHIDSCMGCLACETTCPSSVAYRHLLEDARPRLDRMQSRALGDRLLRLLLTHLLPYRGRFKLAMRLTALGKMCGPLLPKRMRNLLSMAPARLPEPAREARPGISPAVGVKRMRVALLTGCVQQVLGPQINDATVRLLNRLGAEVVIPKEMGCCGALTYHMGERDHSMGLMRRNIEVWHQEITGDGLDAIVLNTSGCGTVVREYDHIFRNDPAIADKASAVAKKVRDVSEVVAELGLATFLADSQDRKGAGAFGGGNSAVKVAYHDACSLQHGQRVKEAPRELLATAGFEVVEVSEGHICCGSAGTYNMLEPEMAAQLGERKAAAVEKTAADVVAAGNIGCMEQIGAGVTIPVVHTVELLDWATGGPCPQGLQRGGSA
jgi:glycolate oxidase iron-sulfur subunit